jgi:hypothetical protein
MPEIRDRDFAVTITYIVSNAFKMGRIIDRIGKEQKVNLVSRDTGI